MELDDLAHIFFISFVIFCPKNFTTCMQIRLSCTACSAIDFLLRRPTLRPNRFKDRDRRKTRDARCFFTKT